MQELNRAFDLAVKAKLRPPEPTVPAAPRRDPERMRRMRRWVDHDHPSFSIDALPAEAFEALLVATSWLGEVLVDDPPYVLEVHLHDLERLSCGEGDGGTGLHGWNPFLKRLCPQHISRVAQRFHDGFSRANRLRSAAPGQPMDRMGNRS